MNQTSHLSARRIDLSHVTFLYKRHCLQIPLTGTTFSQSFTVLDPDLNLACPNIAMGYCPVDTTRMNDFSPTNIMIIMLADTKLNLCEDNVL